MAACVQDRKQRCYTEYGWPPRGHSAQYLIAIRVSVASFLSSKTHASYSANASHFGEHVMTWREDQANRRYLPGS